MPTNFIPNRVRGAVLFGVLLAACSGESTSPERGVIPLALSLRVYETGISLVTLEVSAPDLAQPITVQGTIAEGFATATFDVPEGPDRTVTVRAFDAGDSRTHSGSVTLDLSGSPQAALSVPLEPEAGGGALVATVAGWRIAIEHGFDTLNVGETGDLEAHVIDGAGDTLDVVVSWESEGPDVIEVLSTGDRSARVEAVTGGVALVVATYRGVSVGVVVTAIVVEEPPPDPLTLELVASGFQSPVHITHAPTDSSRLFVVERGGVIWIIKDGTVLPTPFLDISGQVKAGGEQGLLSVAFHPLHAANREFFVLYTDVNGDSRVSRFLTDGTDFDVADPSSESLVLFTEQPYTNHNGGLVAFGPDGMLYVGLGDGGSGGDPLRNGQDSTTVLGAILRLNVDGGSPYAIPIDNPLVSDAAAAKEIWVYGLRNPWRYSFDRETGDLYIGDVGQGAWEEIDVQPSVSAGGENYGWNVMEGAHCYNAVSCDQSGLVLPTVEYPHTGGACSVTGGYVYRGGLLPDMVGRYLYADYCAGWIRSFRYSGGVAVDPRDHSGDLGTLSQIVSFGEDAAGELYIVRLTGAIYRLAR
jgi:glucose/arabinose dehydrogenase